MLYKNILLIDDDEDDQEIFLTALQRTGRPVSCTTLSSALEAMHLLSEGKILPDIIFLDLNLPEMNGQEFLLEKSKHEQLNSIPVIVLSTSAHRQTIELTKELGATDFVSKPGSFDDIIFLLDSVLKH